MLRLYRYYYYKMYCWMAFVKDHHPKDTVIFGVSMPISLYWIGLSNSLAFLLGFNLEDLREMFIASMVLLLMANFWYFKFATGHAKIMSEFETIDAPVKKKTSLIAFLFTLLAFPFPWLMASLVAK